LLFDLGRVVIALGRLVQQKGRVLEQAPRRVLPRAPPELARVIGAVFGAHYAATNTFAFRLFLEHQCDSGYLYACPPVQQ
jgi:hypothetical protein